MFLQLDCSSQLFADDSALLKMVALSLLIWFCHFPFQLDIALSKLRQMASPLFHFHLFFPDSHSTGPLETARSFSSSQNIVCLQSGRPFCFSPHLLPSVPTQAQHCLVPFICQSCGPFFLTIFPHFSLTLKLMDCISFLDLMAEHSGKVT